MKSNHLLAALATISAAMMLAACSRPADEPAAETSQAAEPVPAGMVRGPVLETMNSGGYTYVLVDTGKDQRWIAGRETMVKVGDVIQTIEGVPMQGFGSRTLDRTFDVIYFVDTLTNLTAPAASAAMPTVLTSPPAEPVDTSVDALEQGKDIAYVYANKDTLAGNQVSLRGKVVKYNSGILGWNFIHIQDGSGDAADGSNDLIVTTRDAAAVGQTIVLTGTVVLDKDFGAGYLYPVLVEDASISTE